jgi:hypothetical protein
MTVRETVASWLERLARWCRGHVEAPRLEPDPYERMRAQAAAYQAEQRRRAQERERGVR